MMIKIVSSLTFILLIINARAQEGVYKIRWTENGSKTFRVDKEVIRKNYLKFEGAFYDNTDFIPKYIHSEKLPGDNHKIFRIKEMVFEPIPDSLLAEVELPDDLEFKQPVVDIYKSGETKFLDITINTIRKNPESGKIERLVQFNLVADQNDVQQIIKKNNYKAADHSLLSSGYWYKIKVKKTGIYKLTYSDLVSMGFSNISNIRVFGYGGKQLSYYNRDPRPVDMAECPIYMNKGSDGTFNSGDYILFYAEGPLTWSYDNVEEAFNQNLHGYSGSIYYFLTTDHGEASQITTQSWQNEDHDLVINTYNDRAYYEKNLMNLIRSGRTWFSRNYDVQPYDTTFTFSNIKSNAEVKVKAKVAGRSSTGRYTYLKVNGTTGDSQFISYVSFAADYFPFANNAILDYDFNTSNSNIRVELEYEKVVLSDEAFLDYVTVNAQCNLNANSTPFFFRNAEAVHEGQVARYDISNVSGNIKVWDISDINNVHALGGELNGSTYSFKALVEDLREYVLVDLNYGYPKPIINDSDGDVGEVPNQNIRNYSTHNYIIIAPEVFIPEAERLAEFYRFRSDLSVLVVTPEEIYNEFSSGTPDVSAIRDFVRNQYINGSGSQTLKYLLLFGDGSYNNHMNKSGNTNYILTYQSENSTQPTYSHVSDDFFGFLDENEGATTGYLDIGIGRFTVKATSGDIAEARQVVDKVISYYDSELGSWRRQLCFMGDDGYDGYGSGEGVTHMDHANQLAEYVKNNYPGFNIKKIFLDAYPQVTSSTGPSYPEAKEDLLNSINKGTLLLSYNGHGGENGITAEKTLQTQDILAMDNSDMLPLFITATCEFSRFDDVMMEGNSIDAVTSAGEYVLLNPDGGGIGLLSTTRVVYADSNLQLAKEVFSQIFSKDENGEKQRMGDIVRKAKNALPASNTNKLNFSLLGDPALMLAFPEYKVFTDSINNHSVLEVQDTLKAFSEVKVSGYVAYDGGNVIENFNGYIYPNVFDKPVEVTTLGNDDVTPYQYTDQTNLIYKGKATVRNGRFTFNFIVPKDISYSYGLGMINYYAENSKIDAKGEFRDVYIGGTNNNAEFDYSGPDIKLFMNNEQFVDGGITNMNPYICAELSDESGINTTGIGIGHDIVAVLDYDDINPYVLNDYYETEINDYTSGIVNYQLRDLEDGEHYLMLKAWDVYNNSSEANLSFVVKSSDGIIVQELINYPNPVTHETSFTTTFQYSHNQPGEQHEVILEIFDLSGRLVYLKKYSHMESGFVSTPITWDLRSNSGNPLQSGIYPYRLKVTTSEGFEFMNQRLIIIR
ncbi:MAG: type IX secretion system sortase PorU [Bacteroidales bacterium]|nr:type IX secretion system sortase PorU [Bacteroidales bacterium]